jgi:non-ribosomal peptide synthetase component F
VERAPNAAAVVFEDQQLTYRELNRAANKLARHLRKLGVAPEATVGICIERSLEMVVGVLGILKAGGAYVYLDPTLPKERLAFIMGDAGVRVLLTRKHLLENLPEYSGRAIFLDRDSGMFLEEEDSNVQATSDPESLAYVVYTSGSTGKPKGVLSHHRGVANYLGYIRKTYHLHNTDTVLQLPSLWTAHGRGQGRFG